VALFKASGVDQVLLKPLNKAAFVAELLTFIDKRARQKEFDKRSVL
jgi:hypothetical protein